VPQLTQPADTLTHPEPAPCLPLTAHARRRLAQRRLSEQDLAYVLEHGAWLRRTGVDFCVLRRRDVPSPDRAARHRLEGTVILVTDDGAAITVYRNRDAPAAIRRKAKHRRASRWAPGRHIVGVLSAA
jgi:hypothetical protein